MMYSYLTVSVHQGADKRMHLCMAKPKVGNEREIPGLNIRIRNG